MAATPSAIMHDSFIAPPSKTPDEPMDITTLLAQIEGARSFFFAHAAANEAAGRLDSEVFDKLLELGAIHAMVPRALGGSGFDAIDELRLIEALAQIDAGTAWVTMATGFCTAAAAAYLPQATVERIFYARGRGTVAGAGAPTGVARAVAGGFLVTGHWRYGSGILHADWAQCGTTVEVDGNRLRNGDGAPVMRMCYIPTDHIRLGANWDVSGLRATGSVDFFADGVFVPESFSCLSGAPVQQRGSPIFRQSFTLATYIGHSAWAIGAGRRLLDEVARFVRDQGSMRAGSTSANHSFHEKYANEEAKLLAARAFVYDTWQSAQVRVTAGDALTTREVTMIRLALAHVTQVATEIANFGYRLGGGETLRQGPLQRMCRDVQAGGQHMTSADSVIQACGRVLAGLAEGEVWATNGLVKGSHD